MNYYRQNCEIHVFVRIQTPWNKGLKKLSLSSQDIIRLL
jgi:hypothetical protein